MSLSLSLFHPPALLSQTHNFTPSATQYDHACGTITTSLAGMSGSSCALETGYPGECAMKGITLCLCWGWGWPISHGSRHGLDASSKWPELPGGHVASLHTCGRFPRSASISMLADVCGQYPPHKRLAELCRTGTLLNISLNLGMPSKGATAPAHPYFHLSGAASENSQVTLRLEQVEAGMRLRIAAGVRPELDGQKITRPAAFTYPRVVTQSYAQTAEYG